MVDMKMKKAIWFVFQRAIIFTFWFLQGVCPQSCFFKIAVFAFLLKQFGQFTLSTVLVITTEIHKVN